MLKVVRNTYPVLQCPHAELGDIVRWEVARGRCSLVRQSDGKTVFSRDCLPRHTEDNRPVVGVIAQIKSKGWAIELIEAND